MKIKPIHNDKDHRAALSKISRLMEADPELGTPEGDLLEVLATLVEAYESKRFPIEAPDPVEAIKFRMEQQGLSVADMGPYIGRPNRVYEVLNRKRGLSLTMIRRLHSGLGIPADALIGSAPNNPAQTRGGSR